ncbi:hypothetical protein [Bradyrhizobium sp. RDI18]
MRSRIYLADLQQQVVTFLSRLKLTRLRLELGCCFSKLIFKRVRLNDFVS